MTEKEQFEKDCSQLGEWILKSCGETREISSEIIELRHSGKEEILKDLELAYFEIKDLIGFRYQVVIGITGKQP